MTFHRSVVAVAAALSLASFTQATGYELPPCVDKFTPFTASGCYTNGDNALVLRSSADGTDMTVEKCTAVCKGNSFRFAGLTYYGACYCGNTVSADKTDDAKCNYPCSGDQGQQCGGQGTINIWQDPTYTKTPEEVTVADYAYTGCYVDNYNNLGRAFGWPKSIEPTKFTPEACIAACKADGFPIAGSEFSHECWCGNVLARTTKVAESECNLPCGGDASKTCGGRDRLSVYIAKDLESHEKCGGSPPSTTSSVPATTSSVPATTSSSASGTTSSAPGTTSSAPGTTSSAPATSSSAPTTSSSAPATSSSAPTTSSSAPATSSSAPTTSSSAPGTTSKRTTTTDRETTTSKQPSQSTTTTSKTWATTTKSDSTTTKADSTSTKPPGTSTKPPGTSTKPPGTSTKPTGTTGTTSVCTPSTTVIPPTCEVKIGKWCLPPTPDWESKAGCWHDWKSCELSVSSCFIEAGVPASLECFHYAAWCKSLKFYCFKCDNSKTCNKLECWKELKPGHTGKPTTVTVPCTATATNPPATSSKPPGTTSKPVTTTKPTTTQATTTKTTTTPTSCPPEPTNVCVQPSSRDCDYGPGNPVGGVPLPIVTCNDVKSDWVKNPFKLYSKPDKENCPTYPRHQVKNVCCEACKIQYTQCLAIYANSCKNRENEPRFHPRGVTPRWSWSWSWGGSGVDKNICKGPGSYGGAGASASASASAGGSGAWASAGANAWAGWGHGNNNYYNAAYRCKIQYTDCVQENQAINPVDECKNWGCK